MTTADVGYFLQFLPLSLEYNECVEYLYAIPCWLHVWWERSPMHPMLSERKYLLDITHCCVKLLCWFSRLQLVSQAGDSAWMWDPLREGLLGHTSNLSGRDSNSQVDHPRIRQDPLDKGISQVWILWFYSLVKALGKSTCEPGWATQSAWQYQLWRYQTGHLFQQGTETVTLPES